MSKVVKGIGRAVSKVVKGIGRAVKRVVQSPLGKVALTVAAAYFAAPIFGKALSAIGQGISGAANVGRGILGGLMGDVGGAAAGSAAASAGTAAADIAAMADVGMGASTSALNSGGLISSLWNGMNTPAGTTLLRMAGGLLSENETAMQINARDRWQREAIERANANQNVGAIRLPGVYAPQQPAPPAAPPAPQPAAMPVNAPRPVAATQISQAPLPGMPVQPVAPDPNVPQNRPWQQPGLIGGAMYA